MMINSDCMMLECMMIVCACCDMNPPVDIVVNDVQLPNTYNPKYIFLLLMVTLLNDEQVWNASLPMDVTLFGIVIDFNDVH